jgi:Xaa-Pro aminopeptidase
MRRGLIARSLAELPDAVLDARLARLHAAMGEAHLDALLLYTNNTRPAGVSWLTGFVPYWSEALLVVPRDGLPVLVAALTYRVKSWIERTSRLADVIHTPRIGLEAGRLIAAAKADARLGIADFGALASGIAADLRHGSARPALTDATELFAAVRGRADPAELALAGKAASIAGQALSLARHDRGLGAIIARVEARARELGAEEIYIAAAPDLARDLRLRRIEGDAAPGASFALRATVAYKGTWIRLVRTFGCDASREEATVRFAQAVAQLPDERGFAGFSSWLVEGCRIAQPLEPLMGSRIAERSELTAGALVSVQARLEIDGQTMLLGGPALIGSPGEAACLL